MAKFLHGVEVLEIDTGPRPIQTVRSGVIGIVGTAPDAEGATAATLTLGNAPANTGITYTATTAGTAGNNVRIRYVDPGSASATLAVTVDGSDITVTLATDAEGAITSTAADIVTAVNGEAEAAALVTAAAAEGSDGTGLARSRGYQSLAGGAAEPFPLNRPTLVAGSRTEAARLGAAGTLPGALEGIFDQVGAVVVVVRVEKAQDEQATTANVVGGVDGVTGELQGVHALAGAESVIGFSPRILCAPGFTHQRESGARNAVVAELIGIAERLRAVVVADGPNTTDDAAQQYANDWGSARVYLVDPWVQVMQRDGSYKSEPPSARVAGIIAKVDNDQGFWWSPSNKPVNGIVGTARAVDFKLGDANSRANLLNEGHVATIIRQNGYRLWGNRTLTDDTKWHFLSVRRTADMINDSIQRAHLWAVDRNITRTYVEDVTDGVNAYIANLVAQGALLGGRCWPDPDLNTPENIQLGKVYFNFEFTPPYPAEHITFRSMLVNDYVEEVFA
ncbi:MULTISPECIES: phage tail sheath subtilisin-like domain-containing protein [unclassified Halomonas]|uniref:phage tail sheath subtilisin-like domain-containing protein n=1 Tax=unclassified Halomonas TaxID=2609666 RepID=UPI0028849306|nr:MULTISPECIES: phage tail sheath subtilisin-like domain-containing protein [unclassified Halomonas]MDT0499719.1 phage tail sheath subtilisin-like domain-containing protein [Halomonas sp. PAR7]MDT0589827.1 phage tail sheath subtilisin-like domain-containing protein [Halomonas sp. PAR8]